MKPEIAAALGIDPATPPKNEQLNRLFEAKRADNGEDWSKNARRISAYDLTLAPHKSVTLAAEFAPTEAERAAIWHAINQANNATMRYVAREIGFARRGHSGEDGADQGEVAWVSFRHTTARPTVEARDPGTGQTYLIDTPAGGDPHAHIHNALFNVVATEDGHVGSLDTKRLRSRVHEFGAYFQAQLADELRRIGIAQQYDANEQATVVSAVPQDVSDFFSKGRRNVIRAAKEYAAAEGLDWADMPIERKRRILSMAGLAARLDKDKGASDHEIWLEQAKSLGWEERSLIGSPIGPEGTREERYDAGDHEQAQNIEAGDSIEMLRRVLDAEDMPELLSSVRQTTARNRQIADLFRGAEPDESDLASLDVRGAAGYASTDEENDDDVRNKFHMKEVRDAIDMKRVDGTIRLVGGDHDEVLQEIARLYVTRRDALAAVGANPRTERMKTISMSALTNQDAADLSRAVRGILQERGEISKHEITVQAIDQRGETYDLAIAAGDRLRPYRRTWGTVDGKGATVGNNGDVVDVLAHSDAGLRIRTKDGVVADVEWRRFQDAKTGKVMLGFGHAMTIDAAQGLTSDEHINAMPRGADLATGFTSYVAESRARGTTWTMISDAATFEAVRNQRALGDATPITSDDLWDHVAKKMANKPYKALGMDLVARTRKARDARIRELIAVGRVQETMATEGRPYGREIVLKTQARQAERSHSARLAEIDAKLQAMIRNAPAVMSSAERALRRERAAQVLGNAQTSPSASPGPEQ